MKIFQNMNLYLTHWGQVMLICISKLNINDLGNGTLPGQCQAIILTNAGILLIWPFETNFNEILIKIYKFSLKKIHLKMQSGKWLPFCLGLNVLIHAYGQTKGIFSEFSQRKDTRDTKNNEFSLPQLSLLCQIWVSCIEINRGQIQSNFMCHNVYNLTYISYLFLYRYIQ